nr:transposase, MuDR [Tanacetum cinerariifolium]
MNQRVVTNELRQSSGNESINVDSDRDHGSSSQNGSDRDHGSDDVEVDMADFKSNIDANVEWVGSKEIIEVIKEGFEDEEVNHDDFDSGSDSE